MTKAIHIPVPEFVYGVGQGTEDTKRHVLHVDRKLGDDNNYRKIKLEKKSRTESGWDYV